MLASLVFLGANGCSSGEQTEAVRQLSEKAFEQGRAEVADEVSLTVHAGLEASLWAHEALLSDPVGINFDNYGRAWVATTDRRRTTAPDAGAVSQWFNVNLSWRSVEDRRAFLQSELTEEHAERNDWLEDFNGDGVNDWRDLIVERDSVFLLEDAAGAGYANRARVMDWDIYSGVTEITGSALYHDGEVLVARAPDLLRAWDSDGDGTWDRAESISHGYGVHIGYSGHGMSGLKMGPDGRIYWAIGDMGINVEDEKGRRWQYPDEGAIIRADPDGSNLEVYASGLRNVHEFDFDKYGNLIGIDNDGPPEDYDRLVYLIDGSDSGWRTYWQMGKFDDPKNNDYSPWVDEAYYNTADDHRSAHVLPPLAPSYNGPAGFVYNPGTALGPEWEDYFFASSFVGSPTQSGINAFTLKQKGASFEVDTSQAVLRGVLSTSLDVGPGGALYTTDWIEGWVTKGTGRVWKVDVPDGTRPAIRAETEALLAIDFANYAPDELLEHLRHADMRVRKKAQFELAERGDTVALLEAANQTEHQLARLHGLWGLAQVGRRQIEAAAPLTGFLGDPDPVVRAQAAKMLGDVRYAAAAEELLPLLQDESARVRLFATEALGRIGYRAATAPIVEMLKANDDDDAYLSHAGVVALARIGDEEALAALSSEPSVAVREIAVAALGRLESPGVVRFLEDENEAVVTEAARAINDDAFITEGLGALAAMLDQRRLAGEPLLRRAINASLYHGGAAEAERLARFALREEVSEELRAEALETLSVWPESSVLGRVTGKHRGAVQNDPAHARRAIEPVVARLADGASSGLKMAAVRAASNLEAKVVTPSILDLALGDSDPEVRVAALEALGDLEYEKMETVIAAALEGRDPAVRMSALQMLPEQDVAAADAVALLERVLARGTVDEKQAALGALVEVEGAAAYEVLAHQVDRLLNDRLDRELQLDLMLAVEAVDHEPLNEKLAAYEAAKPQGDSLAVYVEALYGGDLEKGRQIFNNHAGAQCYRCHLSEGEAGPELAAVGAELSRKDILRALVDPGARVAPGYGTVSLTLDDGAVVRGALLEETETQVVLTLDGQRHEISKREVDAYEYGASSMPAMGGVLTRREIRDVVEYLASLGGA